MTRSLESSRVKSLGSIRKVMPPPHPDVRMRSVGNSTGRLSVTSTNGNVTLGGTVSATGNVLINAKGAVSYTGAITAGTDVTILGASLTQDANLTATAGTIDLEAATTDEERILFGGQFGTF